MPIPPQTPSAVPVAREVVLPPWTSARLIGSQRPTRSVPTHAAPSPGPLFGPVL